MALLRDTFLCGIPVGLGIFEDNFLFNSHFDHFLYFDTKSDFTKNAQKDGITPLKIDVAGFTQNVS
jgi:hypothetical protein